MPTETAISLREPVLRVLDGLSSLTDQRPFDPRTEEMEFVIAANDLQRELIFPRLWRESHEDGIRLRLEFMPSGVPSISMLRNARCQLILTPIPPDAPDIFQRRLISGAMMCFYDASVREAPKTSVEYLNSNHITVRFAGGLGSSVALRGADIPELPEPTLTVSNFNAIPSFVKGTDLIATEMSSMHIGPLRDLAMGAVALQERRHFPLSGMARAQQQRSGPYLDSPAHRVHRRRYCPKPPHGGRRVSRSCPGRGTLIPYASHAPFGSVERFRLWG